MKRGNKMNTKLVRELEYAIDIYNDGVDEDDYIYWWDILNEMNDLTDDAEVSKVIREIKREAERITARA